MAIANQDALGLANGNPTGWTDVRSLSGAVAELRLALYLLDNKLAGASLAQQDELLRLHKIEEQARASADVEGGHQAETQRKP